MRRYVLSTLLCAASAVCRAERGAFRGDRRYEDVEMGLNPTVSFQSTNLTAPIMNIAQWDPRCDSDDLILTAPLVDEEDRTAMIVDQRGHLVWGTDLSILRSNLHVAQYKGEDYLVLWERRTDPDTTPTSCRMLNHHYEQVYSLVPTRHNGNGHVCQLTIDDTAIVALYEGLSWNLTSYGLSEDGRVTDAVVQELNIETGELLFEWRATDHYSFADMAISKTEYKKHIGTKDSPWDAYHLNSAEKDVYGNFLISMRYLNGLIYVSGRTGEVLWQLGGKNNTFSPAAGTDPSVMDFVGQHDAHFVDPYHPEEITVFDNHGWNKEHKGPARGVKIRLDTTKMEATLLTEYKHPADLLVQSQGSHQTLTNGHSFVGWGFVGAFSEFAATGELLCDTHMAPLLIDNGKFKKSPHLQSYRTLKQPWIGYPKYPPDVAIANETLYVSWNGATEVYEWKLEGSEVPDTGEDQNETWINIDTRAKTAFEVGLPMVADRFQVWRLSAIERNGQSLGKWLIDGKAMLKTIEQPIKSPKHRKNKENHRNLQFRFSTAVAAGLVFGIVALSALRFCSRPPLSGQGISSRLSSGSLARWYRRLTRRRNVWLESETKGLCDAQSDGTDWDENDTESMPLSGRRDSRPVSHAYFSSR